MELLDIHTHHSPSNPLQAIMNVVASAEVAPHLPSEDGFYSIGYHPWYLSSNKEEDWDSLAGIAGRANVLAIGETGLDKLANTTTPNIQEYAFRKHIEISEMIKKPLIIHAVHSFNEVIHLKKELNPVVPWIIHGFRGKKEMAKQLTDHGFYLSLGEKYNKEALKTIPVDKLFLETDESDVPILTLYQNASQCLDLSANELIERVQQNINIVFK
ncbi:TatD family hydrolase [Bacteroides sp. 224]|uniref:TatD family hydrolase n=1 Tax=Bacteroides sp. 224 TaxID=2302936 RepID=UPI0013D798B8|nr:TatD family hydrolase [Bacteroides sp. 224]NDV65713.1 TatD family deoxyribonuclease [Bacteroides sp. 224]